MDSVIAEKFIKANDNCYTSNVDRTISEITIHHMACISSSEKCGEFFASNGTHGSAHYGIGVEGDVCQYVLEKDCAWDSPAYLNNISIECSNCNTNNYEVSDATMVSLIKLLIDITKRYNLYPLEIGKTLTWHSMYDNTICPGNYLIMRMKDIATIVNTLIQGNEENKDNKLNNWSEDGVIWCMLKGIIKGDNNGNLMLRKECTREEICVMLKRCMGNIK